MEQPNYYAIIPANIRYDKRLTPNAKLLYAEITALTNMNGKCFATNDYFAKLYGVSKVSISKWIKNLIDFGYIESEIIYKDGSKEIDNRYIRIVYDPIKEKLNTPIKEKLKDNNNLTDSNNNLTDSNIYIKEFEDFWSIYPKQRAGSKEKAYKSFCRAIKEKRSTADKIISSAREYAQSEEVKRGFAKGCQAWLNDDRFNSDYRNKIEVVEDEYEKNEREKREFFEKLGIKY